MDRARENAALAEPSGRRRAAGGRRARRPGYRWWQVACRAALAAALLAAAAYVTLPWWAPTGWLARRIAASLARQLGCDVQIGSLRLDWTDGVEIRELTVGAPPGFGTAPTARVRSVRTDLSPVNLLINRRLAWMELDQPQLHVRLRDDGRVNLEALAGLRMDVTAESLHLRGGQMALHVAGVSRPVVLRVHDLQAAFDGSGQVGAVSMSAAVEQRPGTGDAPVSLSRGQGGPDVAAAASLRFANLDLGELPLSGAAFGARPMRGLCRGRLDLQLSRRGVVDAFALDLSARGLGAAAKAGPDPPLIDEASLSVTAAYDHLNGALEVRSAALRLPGLDLHGEAKLFWEALRGHPEGLERLAVAGRVQPALLAAAMRRGEAPGALAAAGPVELAFRARREAARTLLGLSVAADAATLRRGSQVVKPAGRACRVRLEGTFLHRPRRLVVGDAEIALGGNRFLGHGALEDVGLLAGRLASGGEPSVPEALAKLAGLAWQGSCEVRDVPALADLLPPELAAWRGVRLDGTLRGQLQVERDPKSHIHASLHAPAEAHLAVPGLLVKPPGAALNAEVEAVVEPHGRTVRIADAAVTAGAGRLHVRGGAVELRAGGLDVSGDWSVEDAAALLALCPRAALGDALAGNAGGSFAARLRAGAAHATVTADMRQAAVAGGPWWHKAAGAPAELRLEGELAAPPGAAPRGWATAQWQAPRGRLAATLGSAAHPAASGEAADVTVELAARDAGWLADSVPALASRLGEAKLGGAVRVGLSGRLGRDALDANVWLDANALSYEAAGGPARRKAAGVPLTVNLSGRAERREGELSVAVHSADVRFAAARALVSAEARLVEASAETAPRGKPVGEVGTDSPCTPQFIGGRFAVRGEVALDEALRAALPELDELARRHGLTGRVNMDANAVADGNELRLHVRADGAELAVADLRPAPDCADANGPAWAMLRRLGPLGKPRGRDASVEAAMSFPLDLSGAEVNLVRGRIGGVDFGAEGTAAFRRGEPPRIAGRLTASVARAETLTDLAASLAPYRPAGSAGVDIELADPPAAGGRAGANVPSLRRATLRLGGLVFRYNGKQVTLDGQVDVEDLASPPPPRQRPAGDDDLPPLARLWRVGHLRTDGLEFRAGDNHGWLIADLAGLPDRARGGFHFLAERLDDKDLSDWLVGPPPTEPNVPFYKLSPGRIAELRRDGRRAASMLTRLLAGADVSGRVSVAHMRTFDRSVGLHYDVRQMEATVRAAGRQVSLAYRGGLNGGTVRSRYSFRPEGRDPNVAVAGDMTGILGEDNFQPQLAKFFPRNTVRGSFSRRQRTGSALSELLAGLLDGRYPVRMVGQSYSVAEDGFTEGRAAPQFVAKIFPGLNLTRYHYRRMTTFAEHRPDGTTANDMVFDGRDYDLYVEGTTDVNNIGRYEIGLILLGAPQTAAWNHTYRQGRIPILNFQARIEGGKMRDEQVSYLRPNETLFVIFLKHNLFYRLWLAAGKKSSME